MDPSLFGYDVVLVYWMDVELKACVDGLPGALDLCAQTNVAVHPTAVALLVVTTSVSGTMSLLPGGGPCKHVQLLPVADSHDLRRRCGFGLVLPYPSLCVFERKHSSVLCTNGMEALRRGLLVPGTFPTGWRTNCFCSVRAAMVPTARCVAFPSSDAMYRCGLYAGDIVRVQALSSSRFVYAYVNPPEVELPFESLPLPEGTPDLSLGDVVFVHDDLADSLFGPGDEGVVTVEPATDVPEGEAVELATPPGPRGLDELLLACVQPHFGIGPSGRAVVPTQVGGTPISDWMSEYLASSSCLFVPVWPGQTLTLDGVPFVVQGTAPSGPVIVGPKTKVHLVRSATK